ncbi:MAG: MFS transporter [Hydrogenophilaceae bacterium]|jgi:MFS family permease|nr:MFS transporter [Hydrogenophilaceae bacterium]
MSQAPPRDRTPRLVYAARALRDFGDGFLVLLLPVYLAALGFDAFAIGVVATLALLGSALMTLAIGMIGARFGERALLIAASALMAATGIALAFSHVAALIFLIALVGTINPSAGSVSIFVPLEHALLARSVADRERTRTFALYSLIGALAAALGALAAASPDWLARLGLSRLGALQLMFLFYAVLGVAGGALYARIPRQTHRAGTRAAPLSRSRTIVLKLAALFSVDAFAGGFAVPTLMALWLYQKFDLSLTSAGAFFMVAGLLGALSQPVAGWLGARIGLINTMVWTHIPASLALIAAALAPSLELALGLLLARALLSQMDVPARASYVMAVVAPEERSAAASVTAVPRSLAAAASPALAGALFASGYAALPFMLCGALKIAYDLTLLALFHNLRPPEER